MLSPIVCKPKMADWMGRTSVLAGVLAGLAALAAPSVSPAAGLQDENLITAVPDHFQAGFRDERGGQAITEFVPQGETVEDWSRMVTVQIFHNLKHFDPARFGEGMKSRWLAGCAGSDVQKVKDLTENGYPVSLWVFTCPKSPQGGGPENMFAKFIGGNDSFYSLQYAYRTPLTKDIIPPTEAYLAGARVCDTRLPDRPCPTVAP